MAARKKTPKINREVQAILTKLDVDMVGVVRINDLKNRRLRGDALKLLPAARSIVVLGMEIYPEFLDLTSSKKVTGAANLYDLFGNHLEYIAGKLNKAAYDIALASHRAGLKALPLPSRKVPTDRRTLQSIISYKHAAEAAGLGNIGMSSLLVTQQYGPRVRLNLCLTEAVLKSTAGSPQKNCSYCNVCVVKCPANALGRPENGATYVINKFACREYMEAVDGCSECMRVCPVASPIYE